MAPAAARAGDAGARHSVAQIRSDARRLLAQRVRRSGLDPKVITIADVGVVDDQAVLSWSGGERHGVMGLVRRFNRWWDAFDETGACTSESVKGLVPPEGFSQQLLSAAAARDAGGRPSESTCAPQTYSDASGSAIVSAGGVVRPNRSATAGYALTISYARNDAAPGTTFSRVYVRAPTQAEMLENPVPPRGWGGPDAVCFFDLEIQSSRPITFTAGTKVEVWFPFVLDDTLKYELGFVSDGTSTGPAYASIFDNALDFTLPSFSIAPRQTLMAEIDADW